MDEFALNFHIGGNQGWNQSGPNNYNPNPQSYQNHPGSQGGGNSNWSNNESFGCNYQQGFNGGPMRSNFNNQRSNPYGNSNSCPPSNYGFGKCLEKIEKRGNTNPL